MLCNINNSINNYMTIRKDHTTELKFHFCLHIYNTAYSCTEQMIEFENSYRFLNNYKAWEGMHLTRAVARFSIGRGRAVGYVNFINKTLLQNINPGKLS